MGRLRVERNAAKLPSGLRSRFDHDGRQVAGLDPADLLAEIEASRSQFLRISQDVEPWLEARSHERDRVLSRREYEAGIAASSFSGS
jgi:hypothetical protein